MADFLESKRDIWLKKAAQLGEKRKRTLRIRSAGIKPRKPILVFCLELFPGLIGLLGIGHIYNRRRKKGGLLLLTWAVIWWGSIVFSFVFFPLVYSVFVSELGQNIGGNVFLLFLFFTYLAPPCISAINAFFDAKRDQREIFSGKKSFATKE
ncbi:MAG: hypothetical protein ABH950_09275 [Candidatus Altiarchaeota archaeon]